MKPTMKRGKWASVPNLVYLISTVAEKEEVQRESRGASGWSDSSVILSWLK